MMSRLILISLLATRYLVNSQPSSRPHIITIVVDDLGRAAGHYLSVVSYPLSLMSGWNDVPWNNPDSYAVNLGKHAR